MMRTPAPLVLAALALAGVASAMVSLGAQSPDVFRFRSGIELINVAATVTTANGRFVPGLGKADFSVYEDGKRQEITHFSNEPVPVSLGILLDASGSMSPDKMSAARAAIDRFIFDLLGTDDELFFVEFADSPRVLQSWTTDRRAISRAVARVQPGGGTALFDAVAYALPMAEAGRNVKKALLVISDGNDQNSRIRVGELRQLIRESEVLVYALGVDGSGRSRRVAPGSPIPLPLPLPFPFPGSRRPQPGTPPIGGTFPASGGASVNADVLRQITDDTGGRAEIVRGFDGLDAATSRIADELSKQYYLGYASDGEKDGRWHSIRVEVRDPKLTVRARTGYIAS